MRHMSSSWVDTFMAAGMVVKGGLVLMVVAIAGFLLAMLYILLVDGSKRCRDCGGKPLFTATRCARCVDDAQRWMQEWSR